MTYTATNILQFPSGMGTTCSNGGTMNKPRRCPQLATDRHRWVMKSSQLGRKAYKNTAPSYRIVLRQWGLLKFHTTPSTPMSCLGSVLYALSYWSMKTVGVSIQATLPTSAPQHCFHQYVLPLKEGESDKCKFSGGLHKDHRMHPTIAAISIPPLKVGESDKFDKSGGLNTEQRWLQ